MSDRLERRMLEGFDRRTSIRIERRMFARLERRMSIRFESFEPSAGEGAFP